MRQGIHFHAVQWIRDSRQMPVRQVKINHGILNILMTEQDLDRAQVGAGFEQMRGVAMAQGILVLLMICTPERFAIAITRGMA
jgi:hypothetical protein